MAPTSAPKIADMTLVIRGFFTSRMVNPVWVLTKRSTCESAFKINQRRQKRQAARVQCAQAPKTSRQKLNQVGKRPDRRAQSFTQQPTCDAVSKRQGGSASAQGLASDSYLERRFASTGNVTWRVVVVRASFLNPQWSKAVSIWSRAAAVGFLKSMNATRTTCTWPLRQVHLRLFVDSYFFSCLRTAKTFRLHSVKHIPSRRHI